MDIDSLKAAWQQHDQMLSANLQLNETLLRKANLKASRKELNKPLVVEILDVVCVILLIPLFGWLTFRLKADMVYLSAGLLLLLSLIVLLVVCLKTMAAFYKMDYFGSSVIQIQEQLARLRVRVLVKRKFELFFLPLLVLPALLILLKVIQNIDVHDRPAFILVSGIIAMILSYVGVILGYKYLYEKKIKDVTHLLKEIRDYKSAEG